MLAAIGATSLRSTGVPEDEDVAKIRFTPITAGYRSLVRLSLGIARNRGLLSDTSPDGQTTGVLLDVAELWELFVLEALRRARPRARVVHGTHDARANGYLLTGKAGASLGRLMPDALIIDGESSIVADAKYKSAQPRASRPNGVEREDLYQMRAYVSRWSGAGAGMLVYPFEGSEPPVVTRGPWVFDDGRALHFVTLPIVAGAAVPHLEQVLSRLLDSQPGVRRRPATA
jgi:5-methylcytosine-specific restriction enzyme subunit McrC